MKIGKAPKVGWGIMRPDPELAPETLELLAKLRALPQGQQYAILTRAVPRFLSTELGHEHDQEPSAADMVRCSGALANWFLDMTDGPG